MSILSVITYLEFISLEKSIVKHNLLEVSSELEDKFEDSYGSYENILRKENALNKPIDQQIKIMNDTLQPLVNTFIQKYPGIGLGLYSLSQDRVVAFGPNFTRKELIKIPSKSPFAKSHISGKPEFTYSDNSLTWKTSSILNLSYPIYHENKVIGHLWSNVKLNDIYVGALIKASRIILAGLILSGIFILLSWRIFTRVKYELEEFGYAVTFHNNDMPEGILPELTNLLKLIKESESKYRTIFENTGTAMSISEKDNTLTLVNMEFCKLTGYTKDSIENKMSWTEFVAGEHLEKLQSYYRDLFLYKNHSHRSVEFKLIDKNGIEKDIFITTALIPGTEKCVASLLDITEQKRSEQELIHSKDRFYKTFRSTPSSMSITRVSDGRIIDVNNGFYLLTGYTFDEVFNCTRNELKLWKSPEQQDIMFEDVKKKGYVNNLEMTFITKSGEERHGLLSAEKIELDGEECIIILVMDVTERNQLKKEMKQLDRLNLIGEMAAGIGHEIRNPMTTVRGFLQLLSNKEEYIKDKAYFDLMIDELDRANAIIKEYLTLAKNKTVDLVSLNLNSIMENLYPLIKADAIVFDKYVKLELNEIHDLLLDEKEIRQLILNLTRNGLEAMTSGGTLIIKTYMKKDKVVLSFQDQGKGIEPEIMEKIGTPFFTTKEYGTGLGLAVCYSIAARHNAHITFETSNLGTIFNVDFDKTKAESKTA